MADRVTISNLALAMAETRYQIVDPDDEGPEAQALRIAWDITRQGTIRGAVSAAAPKWNFATRFAPLAARAISAASPLPYGWSAAYPFAEDHLRVVQLTLNGDAVRGWKVANGEILARVMGPLNVEYLVDVPETAQWDAAFTETFAVGLAAKLCGTLGGRAALRKELRDTYDDMLRGAAKVDAREDPPVEPIEADWVMARYAGHHRRAHGTFDDTPDSFTSLVAGRG